MIQSPIFWLVLATAVLVYWNLPQRFRFTFLASVSYLYLAWLEPVGSTILIGWVLVFFYCAPQAVADNRRGHLTLLTLVGAILAYLFWYKYLPGLIQFLGDATPGVAIAVPLGISYFSFKLIHYAIEVARGNITDRSLSRFFCYIFLFPIFTAGPIERFDHFIANTSDTWDRQLAVDGLTRIIHGLIKAFLLAQFLSPGFYTIVMPVSMPASSEQLLTHFDSYSALQIWIFLAITYLYAYLDFSAYTDIAIGASRLFGFRIMENFNWPILAINIQDFWRRWHMTLAGWCQSYIYLPVLARTRTPYAAVFATFTVMGLWHGAAAGWIMWGLYHAAGVSLYMTWARYARRFNWWRKLTQSPLKYQGILFTFAFVTGSYAFSSMGGEWRDSLRVFSALFGIRL